MGRQAAACGRRGLLRRVGPLFVGIACGAVLALPSLAAAEPLSCPAGVLETEELGQPEFEVRQLRVELREVCKAITDRQDDAAKAAKADAEAREAALSTLHADLVQIREALTVKGGLPVLVEGQVNDLVVKAPEGVEVTNPPNLTPVEQATVQNSETVNQTAWAIFGLIVGFGILAWVYKLVRP